MIRDETGLGEVVDDLGLVHKLAAENGTACDEFVEVIITTSRPLRREM